MTWQEYIQSGAARLASAEIESPAGEARRLWEHASGLSYAEWLVHPVAITEEHVTRYEKALARRERREPFHYIVGCKEFMGLSLHVSPAVLIPRPETETLVETVLDHMGQAVGTVVDVGTGSGAIALALRQRLADRTIRVIGIDSSSAALSVATANGERLGLSVEWIQGNLLDPVDDIVDVVVANLPYVSTQDREQLAPELHYEPDLALYAGPAGTELLGQLIDGARDRLSGGGYIFLEIGQGQAAWVKSHLRQQGFGVGQTVCDYGGIERVVWARRED